MELGSASSEPVFYFSLVLNEQVLKGTVSRDFFCFWFFYESVSPQPQSILLGPFRIFPKIRGNIRKSWCTTGNNDTGGKFATGVNHTGGNIAAGINDTGSKFATGINQNRRQILPPVSLVLLTAVANLPPVLTIPAANLPPVSTTPVAICHRYQRHRWQILPPVSMTPVANNWSNIRLLRP
jgi:hypothetical protein